MWNKESMIFVLEASLKEKKERLANCERLYEKADEKKLYYKGKVDLLKDEIKDLEFLIIQFKK